MRHCLRDSDSLKKNLLLVDNMPLCLAIGKGRSSSPLLKGITREVAALSLAFGVRFVCRWVVSEFNVADSPSRGRRPWGGPWDVGRPEALHFPSFGSSCGPGPARLPLHPYSASKPKVRTDLKPYGSGSEFPLHVSTHAFENSIDSAQHSTGVSLIADSVCDLVPGHHCGLEYRRRNGPCSSPVLRQTLLAWYDLQMEASFSRQ